MAYHEAVVLAHESCKSSAHEYIINFILDMNNAVLRVDPVANPIQQHLPPLASGVPEGVMSILTPPDGACAASPLSNALLETIR